MDKNNQELIETFLTRGVEAIYPSADELRQRLITGKKMRVYQGFDPTGPYLHIGHAIGIRALRILQELGHEVIFLVGDFTAKAGDPDKNQTRDILSDKQIKQNMSGWKEQASQLISFSGRNAVKFKRNYAWLSKLKLNDIIKLMSHTTVQRMAERDLFARRLKENSPIKLHEFIYPLMQGYDGVAMQVDMEIGGADQIFNMLTGRDLSKAYLNQEKFVRANKMMDAPDGRTMSKTQGNSINLGDTAEDMYGKAMSYPDSAIAAGLELLTDISMDEIKNIEKKIKTGENPMQYKKLMAFEIVRSIKGNPKAVAAENYFKKTVQQQELPDDMPEVKIADKHYNIIELIQLAGFAASNSESRRLVAQNGVKLNDATITDAKKKFTPPANSILRVGKRKFVKLIK